MLNVAMPPDYKMMLLEHRPLVIILQERTHVANAHAAFTPHCASTAKGA